MKPAQSPLEFKIHGMDCAEEVAVLTREVGPIAGGEERLAFDILNGKMIVQPTADGVTPEAIIRAVARTGMRADLGATIASPQIVSTFRTTAAIATGVTA